MNKIIMIILYGVLLTPIAYCTDNPIANQQILEGNNIGGDKPRILELPAQFEIDAQEEEQSEISSLVSAESPYVPQPELNLFHFANEEKEPDGETKGSDERRGAIIDVSAGNIQNEESNRKNQVKNTSLSYLTNESIADMQNAKLNNTQNEDNPLQTKESEEESE